MVMQLISYLHCQSFFFERQASNRSVSILSSLQEASKAPRLLDFTPLESADTPDTPHFVWTHGRIRISHPIHRMATNVSTAGDISDLARWCHMDPTTKPVMYPRALDDRGSIRYLNRIEGR